MKHYRTSIALLCILLSACAAETQIPTETQDPKTAVTLPPTWTLEPTDPPTNTPAPTATNTPTITPTATLGSGFSDVSFSSFAGADYWWLQIPKASLVHASGTRDGGMLLLLRNLQTDRSGQYSALRMSVDGTITWQIIIDGLDYPTGIMETIDGGVLITENTQIHKLDAQGVKQWSRYYEYSDFYFNAMLFSPILEIRNPGEFTQVIGSVGDIITYDREGIPIEGYFAAQMPFILYSDKSVGAPLLDGSLFAEQESRTVYKVSGRTNKASAWETRFDFIPFDVTLFPPHFIRGTRDGGALFLAPAPHVMNDGGFAIFVARLDREGDVLWQHIYRGIYEGDFFAIETSDGGFLIANRHTFYGPDYAGSFIRFTKLDNAGFILWDRVYGDGETEIFIKNIIERADGGYYLVGQHGTRDQSNHEAGIALFSIDSQGKIPGCRYLAELPKADMLGKSPDVRTTQRTPGSVYEGDLKYIDSKEIELSLSEADINLEAICTYPIQDLLPEDQTEDAISRIHTFADSDGLLLGGVQGDTWFSASEVTTQITRDTSYHFYNLTSYLGEAGVQLTTPADWFDCPEQPYLELSSEKIPPYRLGLDADWNALPRIPASLATSQSEYIEYIKKWLKNNGLKGTEVSIDSVTKIDLDGDGSDEVLIVANRNEKRLHVDGVSKGEHNIFILRQIGSAGVENLILYERYITQDSDFGKRTELELMGVFDLNGDGVMEIVLLERQYKSFRYFIFDPSGDPLIPVLTGSCGK